MKWNSLKKYLQMAGFDLNAFTIYIKYILDLKICANDQIVKA